MKVRKGRGLNDARQSMTDILFNRKSVVEVQEMIDAAPNNRAWRRFEKSLDRKQAKREKAARP